MPDKPSALDLAQRLAEKAKAKEQETIVSRRFAKDFSTVAAAYHCDKDEVEEMKALYRKMDDANKKAAEASYRLMAEETEDIVPGECGINERIRKAIDEAEPKMPDMRISDKKK